MILVSLALLGFAVADLLRWSLEPVTAGRAAFATLGATAATVGLALLSGLGALAAVLIGVTTIIVVVAWVSFDRPTVKARLGPGYPLLWIVAVVLATLGFSGSAHAISGPIERWYEALAFPVFGSARADQFVLGASAFLFLLATSNQIVRLVLEAAGTPAAQGETTLKGGRILGPMERVLVGAMIVAGDLTGAGIVIAAKGLVRLPEIRTSAEESAGRGDVVTEYFLIGTFASLLVAGGLSALVLAAG